MKKVNPIESDYYYQKNRYTNESPEEAKIRLETRRKTLTGRGRKSKLK